MQLGLSDFYCMTPRQFWNALDGHYERQQFLERGEWERIRWQTCQLLAPHVKAGKELSPKDLIEFPWEREEKAIEVPTEDDMKRILERDKKLKK